MISGTDSTTGTGFTSRAGSTSGTGSWGATAQKITGLRKCSSKMKGGAYGEKWSMAIAAILISIWCVYKEKFVKNYSYRRTYLESCNIDSDSKTINFNSKQTIQILQPSSITFQRIHVKLIFHNIFFYDLRVTWNYFCFTWVRRIFHTSYFL